MRENLAAGVQMVGPECAIPLQTPIENLLAIREPSRWHGTWPRRWPMAELGDVANDFLRQEIDEFIERPDERARLIEQFARHAPTTACSSPRRWWTATTTRSTS